MRFIYLATSLVTGLVILCWIFFHFLSQKPELLSPSQYTDIWGDFRLFQGEQGQDGRREAYKATDSKFQSPHNATLGFQSIQAIVLPHRDDQKDILALLASTYDLDITLVPGVYPDALKITPVGAVNADMKDAPPYQLGEVACWRAHANIWRQMLEEKWQTTLIIEGDADFEMQIRDEMAMLPDLIPQLQQQLLGTNEKVPYDDNDPYHSESWDILQLGWCLEWAKTVSNGTVVYKSPTPIPGDKTNPGFYTYMIYEEEGLDIKALTEEKLKLFRLSLGSQCTTAYAVSKRGAERLLHKQTRSWRGPVDNAIKDMSHDLDLVAFSIVPAPFFQRKYIGHNAPSSDIHANVRKRDTLLNLYKTLDDNIGFDGESSLWELPEDMTERSASMAMSGLLWPENNSEGPIPELAWITRAKEQRAAAAVHS